MKTTTSWKTTLGGVLMAAAPVAANVLPPAWHWVGDALAAIGALVLGASAKDSTAVAE